jgi:hypothetical protein
MLRTTRARGLKFLLLPVRRPNGWSNVWARRKAGDAEETVGMVQRRFDRGSFLLSGSR